MASDPMKGGLTQAGGRGGRRRKGSVSAVGSRRRSKGRWSRVLMPWVEGLEDRRLLATITWNTTAAPTGGDWNVAANWTGGKVPGPTDTASLSKLASPGTVFLNSGIADSISSLVTDSSVNLEIITGSLSLGVASSSTLGGPVTVEPGASLNVGAGAGLTIAAGQTLTDNGAMNLAAGDTITFAYSYAATTTLAVGGTLTAPSADTFQAGSLSSNTTQIQVAAGGHLTATNSTFNLSQLSLDNSSVLNSGDLTGNTFNASFYAPYADVANLAGNAAFHDVDINGVTLPSGASLNLTALATNNASLRYVFYQGFTVGTGATVNVSPNIAILIPASQTVTDNGSMSLGSGDTVTFGYSYAATTTLAVGGTLAAANNDTFQASSLSSNTTQILVNAGGHLTAAGSTFSLTQVQLAAASVLHSGDLTGDTFGASLYVPYGDVQYLGNNAAFDDIDIEPTTIPSGGTLALNAIGVNVANLRYVFYQGFTVAAGATVTVGAGVSILIAANQTVTDNGSMSLGSGDTVTFAYTYAGTTSLAVGGTLAAGTNDTFQASSLSSNTTQIQVVAGGHLTAISSTFSLTQVQLASGSVLNSGDLTGNTFSTSLYVPYGDVQDLVGNYSFNDIDIANTTETSGSTLPLNAIGVNVANLRYVFYQGFTVAAGATVTVGAGVSILLGANYTFTDNGTMSLGSGDTITFAYSYAATTTMAVGGTLSAADSDTFQASSLSSNTTQVVVNAGGHLTAANSTFSLTQVQLAAASVLNSGDLKGDSFATTLYVPYGDVQYLGNNASFNDIDIGAATIPSGGALALNAIGVNVANLRYVFYQGFTVAAGATVTAGANVSIAIGAGQTVTDNGSMSLASGDTVTFLYSYAATTTLAVGGTLAANNDTFQASSLSSNTTQILVNAGGHLTAVNSTFGVTLLSLNPSSVLNNGDFQGDTFNLPISVPYADVPFLAGNYSFQDVNIESGTLPVGGTLSLNQTGVNTANLRYVFAQNFTVAAGATIAVGTNVALAIAPGQTLSDNGTMTLAAGDSITFLYSYAATTTLAVGGTLTAIGDTFQAASLSSNTSQVQVNFGGTLSLRGSSYALSNLTLNSGSTDTMSTVALASVLNVNSGASINIAGNDFTNVPAKGVVASGDANAKIPLAGNYWGTTVIATIAGKIVDHATNGNLPTIVYQPFISGASGTSATPATVTFKPTDQTINLSATVSTTAGVAINEGTETFTILNGTQVIGQATAPANVSNGAVTATYTLPGNTPAGQYIIEASYSGSPNYLPSTDLAHLLTVNPAATTTTTPSASATFNAASNQTINLSAQVSSTAGAINEGTVTFTIYSGGNPVGSPVIANVSGNAASGTYTLLAKTPGGSYTIQADYSDPVDFKTSTGTNTLTVAAAATTLTTTNVAGAFSSVGGEGISLSANVSSAAGTINEGSVKFTITDSSSNQVAQTFVNVANGVASTNYLLPAGTAPGTYNLQAIYNGTSSFTASLPATATLTIGAASTTTTARTITAAAGASPIFTATVTSPGGTVNTGSVTFTVLNGTTPIGTPQIANVTNGTASTSYLIPTNTAVGTYTIQAVYGATTDFGTSSDSTHSLIVTPPGAAKLVIHTQPVSTATAGQPFATTGQPIVVYEEDAFGNIETSDNSTVVQATLGSGAGPLTGTITATVVGGVATFTNLGDNTAGTITLTFASGNLATATSSGILIGAAAASKLAIGQQPASTATAGQVFGTQPVVEEVDQYGNPVTGDSTSTVTAARGDLGTSSLLGNKLTVTLVNGVATFGGLSYNKAESMDITFTSNAGLGAVTSKPVQVAPTTASQLVIQTQPSKTATAGQPFPTQPVVYEEDQFGNLETGDNTTPVTAILTGGSGTLQGTTTVTLSGGAARFSNLADNTAETIALQFSGGGLVTPAPSNPIVVGPAAASKLVVQAQPSTTATAGQAFKVQPVLAILDQNGNIETNDNTTQVTVSLTSGAGKIQGTTTVTVKGGIATFTDLYDTAAGPITLGFSASDGLTAGPSTSILISPDVASKLVITTPPSPNATAGQVFLTQPVVAEEDQYGNIETGDSGTVVTVSLASGTGPLQGTTSVTLKNGVAAFTDLLDKSAETITLQFSGNGLTSSPSGPIVVGAATATGLAIQIQPYANVTAGSPLTDPIVVAEVDQYGNVVKSDSTTQVKASLASGSGTLKGTTTVTLQNGLASFNDLEDDKAGTLTLQFTAGTLPPVVSNPSTVAPGQAATLGVVVNRPPGGIPVGSKFSAAVTAFDAYGNVATSFASPVNLSLASGSAGTLTGTLTQTAGAGVANFTDLSDTTSGSISLDASSGSLASTPSSNASATLNPDVPAKLIIQAQPPQAATAGTAFVTTAQPVVIREVDQYGNLEAGDSTTVVTAFLGSGSGPLQGTLSATLAGGVATFTNLADDTAETIALEFTGGGLTSAASVPIVVSPAAASQLVITQQPTSGTAGQAFANSSQPVVITEKDRFGNVETGDNTTTIAAALASGAGPLKGTTSVTMKGGAAQFTNLEDDTAETIALKFSGGGLTVGPSGSIVISPAGGSQLVIQSEPLQSTTAGSAFGTTTQPVVVAEKDRFGNLVAGDNSTTVTAFVASGTGPLGGTTSATMKGGVATFTSLAEDTAGTFTLQFTGNGLTSPATVPIAVGPGSPAKLVVQTPASPATTAGQTFAIQPVVDEVDQYGNVVTSDNTTVVTVALSGGGQLGGTKAVAVKGGIATFTDLAVQTAGSAPLTFTAGSLASTSSPTITVSPATASKLAIHQPPSATATAGQAFATQPVIYEEDQFGNLIASDNATVVTVKLGSGSGPLQGTLSMTVTGGVATFTDLADPTAEPTSLMFTASGLTPASTGQITVGHAPASQLVLHQPPSSTVTAGQAFATQPVIYEEDQFGNLITDDSTTVVTAQFGAGPLGGTKTAVVKNGIATFTDLVAQAAGSAPLTFTAGSLTPAMTGQITISPAPASQLVLHQPPSASATVGQAFATQPVIDEEDPYGNLITSDNATIVTATLGSGTGPLQGTKSVTVKGGIATFTGLADNLMETITLDFTAGSLTPASTGPIAVISTPAQLVLHQPPSSSATAGQPFATQPVVYEEDQYGNLIAGDNSTVVTVALGGAGQLVGTRSVTVKGGIATFTDLADQTAGPASLVFSAGGLTPATSGPISASPGVPARLVIQQQPSLSATAGQAFGTQPVVYEEDAYGNLEAGDNSTVVTVKLGSGSGPLQGTQSVTMRGGVATFTDLADSVAGTITLDLVAGSLPAVASNAIVVNQPTVIIQKPTPTIAVEHVLTAPAKGKKGKPVVVGFELDFSTGMNPATAGSSGNYTIGAVPAKHGKKKSAPTLTPVAFGASYDPTKHAVTLTIAGKQAFAKGGQIQVIYGDVTSDQGVTLTPSDAVFTIQPKATAVTRG